MRVLQVSNIVSHHQIPLARELASLLGAENFRFAAIDKPSIERQKLGWDLDVEDEWILRAGEFKDDRTQFEQWWDEADIVVCGERIFSQMSRRLKRGMPCLYMSERWWKPPIGKLRLFWPKFFCMAVEFHQLTKFENFHYLAIGPFASMDIAEVAHFKQRIWQWGYFPPNTSNVIKKEKSSNTVNILWAGRMLNWKRVDTLIRALSFLQKKGCLIELTLVGEGPERGSLQKLASHLLRDDTYKFLPPVAAKDIPSLMSAHDVYVLPSSAYEGWGAVINEAMACGLAVVASKTSGAAAAMIDHGSNGFLFQEGDWKDLATQVSRLASDTSLIKSLGFAAQKTILEVWSPEIAARRLVTFCAAVMRGDNWPRYESGPLAPAQA